MKHLEQVTTVRPANCAFHIRDQLLIQLSIQLPEKLQHSRMGKQHHAEDSTEVSLVAHTDPVCSCDIALLTFYYKDARF